MLMLLMTDEEDVRHLGSATAVEGVRLEMDDHQPVIWARPIMQQCCNVQPYRAGTPYAVRGQQDHMPSSEVKGFH